MPTNFEVSVIILLVINMVICVYMASNKSENYETTPTTKPPPRIR
jgi:hypothetical protein